MLKPISPMELLEEFGFERGDFINSELGIKGYPEAVAVLDAEIEKTIEIFLSPKENTSSYEVNFTGTVEEADRIIAAFVAGFNGNS